jgi:hypothetical protein
MTIVNDEDKMLMDYFKLACLHSHGKTEKKQENLEIAGEANLSYAFTPVCSLIHGTSLGICVIRSLLVRKLN